MRMGPWGRREKGALRELEAEEKVRRRVEGGRAVFYRWDGGKLVGKSGSCAASPDRGTAAGARPEGAEGGRSRAGGRGAQNDGQMGAVSGPPLAVV